MEKINRGDLLGRILIRSTVGSLVALNKHCMPQVSKHAKGQGFPLYGTSEIADCSTTHTGHRAVWIQDSIIRISGAMDWVHGLHGNCSAMPSHYSTRTMALPT